MTFYRIIFLYVLLIPTHVWAADSMQFKVYKKYIKEVRRCINVDCYRNVIMKYGSKDTIHTLSKSADEFIQKTFELEKKKAVSRKKKGKIYVVEEIIEGDQVRLRLASKTYRALNETIYFVMEDNKWKIGRKAEEQKEE